MPAPRCPSRRRSARPPRLVRPGGSLDLFDDPRIGDDHAVQGWRVGLSTAGYLRHYFPAFWAQHAAPLPVTTARLIGCFHAFHELADRELLVLEEIHDWPFTRVQDDEIPELVDSYRDHGGALYELGERLQFWVTQPPVRVYGLDGNAIGLQWRQGEDLLSLALSWMLRETAWGFQLSADQLAATPFGQLVAGLPTLDARAPMDKVVDALTWSCPLVTPAPWTLGVLLRYVAGQTHNEFADVSTDEALQDMAWWVEGIYDDPDRLAYECLKQRGARDLAAAYQALDAEVRRHPGLLRAIAGELVDAAYGLAAREACPLYVRLAAEEDVCAA